MNRKTLKYIGISSTASLVAIFAPSLQVSPLIYQELIFRINEAYPDTINNIQTTLLIGGVLFALSSEVFFKGEMHDEKNDQRIIQEIISKKPLLISCSLLLALVEINRIIAQKSFVTYVLIPFLTSFIRTIQ